MKLNSIATSLLVFMTSISIWPRSLDANALSSANSMNLSGGSLNLDWTKYNPSQLATLRQSGQSPSGIQPFLGLLGKGQDFDRSYYPSPKMQVKLNPSCLKMEDSKSIKIRIVDELHGHPGADQNKNFLIEDASKGNSLLLLEGEPQGNLTQQGLQPTLQRLKSPVTQISNIRGLEAPGPRALSTLRTLWSYHQSKLLKDDRSCIKALMEEMDKNAYVKAAVARIAGDQRVSKAARELANKLRLRYRYADGKAILNSVSGDHTEAFVDTLLMRALQNAAEDVFRDVSAGTIAGYRACSGPQNVKCIALAPALSRPYTNLSSTDLFDEDKFRRNELDWRNREFLAATLQSVCEAKQHKINQINISVGVLHSLELKRLLEEKGFSVTLTSGMEPLPERRSQDLTNPVEAIK